MTAEARIRPLRPSDHAPVIAVIDEWWDGRPMAQMLPRLFFDHFTDTSFAADRDGALAGFLVGFVSPAQPGEAYIHFVGVDPGERSQGLGRRLYGTFFDAVRARRARGLCVCRNASSMAARCSGCMGVRCRRHGDLSVSSLLLPSRTLTSFES